MVSLAVRDNKIIPRNAQFMKGAITDTGNWLLPFNPLSSDDEVVRLTVALTLDILTTSWTLACTNIYEWKHGPCIECMIRGGRYAPETNSPFDLGLGPKDLGHT